MSGLLVPLLFGGAASVATLGGGLMALRLGERITPLLAVTAGIVLGVAFIDLLPEALEIGAAWYASRTVLACAALGFAAYLLLARALAVPRGRIRWQAHLAPASLTLHSFLDGVGMGLAFQISPEIGWLVALAVLTHDIADGVNTVSLALAASKHNTALRWLIANGIAPLLGVLFGLVLRLPASLLAPLLASFAGVFMYIGACELVPRSLARDARFRTPAAIVGGMLLMLGLSRLAE